MGIFGIMNNAGAKAISEGMKIEAISAAEKAKNELLLKPNVATNFTNKEIRVNEKKTKIRKVKMRSGEKRKVNDDQKDMMLQEFSIPFINRFMKAKNSRDLNKKITSKLDDIKDLEKEMEDFKKLLNADVSDKRKEGFQNKLEATKHDIDAKKQEIGDMITEYRSFKRKAGEKKDAKAKKIEEMYEDYNIEAAAVMENLDERLENLELTTESKDSEYSGLLYNYFMLEYRAISGARRTTKKLAKGAANAAASGVKGAVKGVSSTITRNTKSDAEKKEDEDNVNAARVRWIKNKKEDIEELRGQLKVAKTKFKLNLAKSIEKRIANIEKDIRDEQAHLEKIKTKKSIKEEYDYLNEFTIDEEIAAHNAIYAIEEKVNVDVRYNTSNNAEKKGMSASDVRVLQEAFNKEFKEIKTAKDKQDMINDLARIRYSLITSSDEATIDEKKSAAKHFDKLKREMESKTAGWVVGGLVTAIITASGSIVPGLFVLVGAIQGIRSMIYGQKAKSERKVLSNRKSFDKALSAIDGMIKKTEQLKVD